MPLLSSVVALGPLHVTRRIALVTASCASFRLLAGLSVDSLRLFCKGFKQTIW